MDECCLDVVVTGKDKIWVEGLVIEANEGIKIGCERHSSV